VKPAAIRRMADIEMMSDILIGLMHGPQGGSAKVIDQYYEHYDQFEEEFPDQTRVRSIFDKVHAAVRRLFTDIDETRWGNRADFYSLFVALGELLRDNDLPKRKEKHLRDALMKFAAEVDKRLEDPTSKTSNPAKRYARAIEKGSNDKARRADRHEALTGLIRPLLTAKR